MGMEGGRSCTSLASYSSQNEKLHIHWKILPLERKKKARKRGGEQLHTFNISLWPSDLYMHTGTHMCTYPYQHTTHSNLHRNKTSLASDHSCSCNCTKGYQRLIYKEEEFNSYKSKNQKFLGQESLTWREPSNPIYHGRRQRGRRWGGWRGQKEEEGR